MELLAPAGNMDAFRGALHAGADAVYLGGHSFGARAYAENFGEEEIVRILQEAHLYGIKVYLTANVLTREREMPQLTDMALRLYKAGLDGVIVQDLGVAAQLRRVCPGLPLHASTQMSVTGRDAVRFLKRLGFTRVVPARELSLQEIRLLKETGMEVEAFIHGAMCCSYSGRCLMSSFLGGRSGNRGRCAGTCRLPYDICDENGRPVPLRESAAGGENAGRQETYPLSMKDLCALPILPDLMDAGIDSFKIEGRMKKAEYAAGVTAIYRKYIDRFYEWDSTGRPARWTVDPADMDDLESLYIRTDLSAGYYHERNGREMMTIAKPGYRGASPALLDRIRQEYIDTERKIPIAGTARILSGEPARLEVYVDPCLKGKTLRASASSRSHGDVSAPVSFAAEGAVALPAQNRPLTEDSIRGKLYKTGDTSFEWADLKIETDGCSFLPVSSLNELRRTALDGLKDEILRRYEPDHRLETASGAAAGSGTPDDLRCHTDPAPQKNGPAGEKRRSAQERSPHMLREPETGSDGESPRCIVTVQSAGQALAVMEFGPDILILDGALMDSPENFLKGPDKSIHRRDEKGMETSRGSERTRERNADMPAGTRIFAALPHIFRETDREWLRRYLNRYENLYEGFLIRNLEEMEFLKERNFRGWILADSSLYCWNRSALSVLEPYCDGNVLPPELDRRELSETFDARLSRMILQVYGRVPMMITANCIRKTADRCTGRNASWYGLTDRTGAVLPVQINCAHCCNVIYNSVPTNLLPCMHDPKDRLIRQAGGIMISFTNETPAQVRNVMQEYDSEIQGVPVPKNRDMVYTYGHYRKGAE